mgnify:CR=1 FL=1
MLLKSASKVSSASPKPVESRRTKSLKNSSSVKDSMGVLMLTIALSAQIFPSPLLCRSFAYSDSKLCLDPPPRLERPRAVDAHADRCPGIFPRRSVRFAGPSNPFVHSKTSINGNFPKRVQRAFESKQWRRHTRT